MDVIPLPWTFLVATGTSPSGKVFAPCTLWYRTTNVIALRGQFEQIGAGAEFRTTLAYQLANDPNAPGIIAAIGTAASGDGPAFGTRLDVLSAFADYRLFRLGWYSYYTGSTTCFGRCGAGEMEIWRAPEAQ